MDIFKQLRNGMEGRRQAPTHKAFDPEIQALKNDDGSDSRVLRFVISTKDEDRDGDTIDQDGWDLTNFEKNPVMLWAHDSRTMPVGVPIKTWVTGGKLKSQVQFPTEDINPHGALVYNAYKAGLLNATSVGFRPIKWIVNEDRKGPWGYPGLDFLEQELLEFSAVPIPSNPNAIMEMPKAFDLAEREYRLWHEWTEKTLDGEADLGVLFDREALEATAMVLKGKLGISAPIVVDVKADDADADTNPGRPAADADDADPIDADATGNPADADPIDAVPGESDNAGGEGDVDASDSGDKGNGANDALVAAILAGVDAVSKQGRTISAANEKKLQAAYDAIGEVLEAVKPDDDDDDDKSTDDVTTKNDAEDDDDMFDLSDVLTTAKAADAVDDESEFFEVEGIESVEEAADLIRDVVARELITPLTGKVL